MKYSILVVNFNMAGLVKQLIQSVVQTMSPGDAYEIFVADNSNDCRFRLSPEDLPPGAPVTLVPLGENRGFVDALNRILPMASGRWVVIMHPDAEVESGCLRAMASFLECHEQAAVVSPDVRYPNGEPQQSRLKRETGTVNLHRLLDKVRYLLGRRAPQTTIPSWDRAADAESEMVISICMMFRAEALRQLGPVDPRLFVYYVNDYLCKRLRDQGWTCHYVKTGRAIHHERFSPSALYPASREMAYKRYRFAAPPRERADYFVFLSVCYPWGERVALRVAAAGEDLLGLLSHLKHRNTEDEDFRQLVRSFLIDLGMSRL